MMRGALAMLVLVAAAAAACSRPLLDPLELDGNRVTVRNQTETDWTNVEIWLNHYYRVKIPKVAAGGQYIIPLDTFVDGYAQRFRRDRTMITDLRVRAKAPDGAPIEVVKQFEDRSLEAVLGGKR